MLNMYCNMCVFLCFFRWCGNQITHCDISRSFGWPRTICVSMLGCQWSQLHKENLTLRAWRTTFPVGWSCPGRPQWNSMTNDQKLTSVATKRTLEWKLKVFPILIWQFLWHHLSSASWHLKKPQFPPRHSKCRANFIWKLRWLSRREEPSTIWRALGKEFPCDHQNRTCQQRISLTSVPFQAFQVGTYIYMYIYIYTCLSLLLHYVYGSVRSYK